jgi:hypothetical protein
MRKLIGVICYVLGGACGVLALQLLLSCEILASFSRVENLRYDFWDFVLITNGHHLAYPNGYLVHLLRDLFVAVWAVVIIRVGREQFLYRSKTRTEKVELVNCPDCGKKTYTDAFCRFCGFNLITHRPTTDEAAWVPVWKVSLLAYCGISVVLLIINLLFSK